MPSNTELVEQLSPELDKAQRRQLMALGHSLNPVLMVGNRGYSENLIENFNAQILAHELIKVKVHDLDEMDDIAAKIHEATGAQLAQKIGKMLLFYKAHPENPKIVLK
ncbi:YhbY family RNA-binding protein [Bradymonas sediminis]|uniref:Ribosome assembly RNA-binding protein YhbY n=1 Tax=Bradymonas sediminis TaxID=1548548 RepID=A0A2Z4FLC0_9DELT|nr:YhbY family RNA-binding protein [Bradymonas sediminis]AWV89610.1 ribosome assembly RNA-binding protein YhbY [Bradymonas sediminis]TDP76654.1 RNA-binding protein [Bradymonas sediminis]